MTQPAKSQEPSMEEISPPFAASLPTTMPVKRPRSPSSRRRGLRRRLSQPRPPKKEPAAPAAAAGYEDQRCCRYAQNLPSSMAAPSFNQAAPGPTPGPAPQFRKIEAFSDVSFDEAEQKPAMRTRAARALYARRRRATAVVDGDKRGRRFRVNTLAQTVLVQNARTLEDLVREMLRPLLKSWLDDDVPGHGRAPGARRNERVARGR